MFVCVCVRIVRIVSVCPRNRTRVDVQSRASPRIRPSISAVACEAAFTTPAQRQWRNGPRNPYRCSPREQGSARRQHAPGAQEGAGRGDADCSEESAQPCRSPRRSSTRRALRRAHQPARTVSTLVKCGPCYSALARMPAGATRCRLMPVVRHDARMVIGLCAGAQPNHHDSTSTKR